MGKHSGKPDKDEMTPREREQIPIDISDERAQQDADIIDTAYGDKK